MGREEKGCVTRPANGWEAGWDQRHDGKSDTDNRGDEIVGWSPKTDVSRASADTQQAMDLDGITDQ